MTGLRRDAEAGSVESIAEDLKFVRGRGGLVVAKPSDLVGTNAALVKADPALARLAQSDLAERARQRLRHAAVEVVEPLIKSAHAEGLGVGALAVKKNLLEDPPDRRTLAAKRREIADEHQRSLDYVRQNEDTVLRMIAERLGRELAVSTSPENAGSTPSIRKPRAGPSPQTSRRVHNGPGKHRLHLVTGTSGTGVNGILQAFAERRGFSVVQVERHFVDLVYARLFGKEPPARGRGGPALMTALGSPEPILREIWQDAWHLATQQTRRALETTDVLLTLHASNYHIGSQGLTTLVDLDLVRSLEPRPVQVVQLADDIYDTLARLITLERPLFQAQYRRGELLVPILMRLAEWRELETIISRAIAGLLGAQTGEPDDVVPFTFFAIKHPVQTFEKLIMTPWARRVYLSHPIAYPRELSSDTSFEDLWSRVESIAAGLRADDDTILFEPTTIDELRFKLDEHNRVTSTELQERWLRVEKVNSRLWNWSQNVPAGFAEQPFVAAANDRGRQTRVDGGDGNEPHAGLDVLRAYLREQVASRDRQLVSQCDEIVALRPFGRPDGAYAGGVFRELTDHNEILKFGAGRLETRRRRAIVYHPRADERRRRQSTVAHALDGMAQQGEHRLVHGWDNSQSSLLRELLSDDLLEDWTVDGEAHDVAQQLLSLLGELPQAPYIALPADETAMGGGTETAGLEEARRLIGERVLAALRHRYGKQDPYARDWLDGLGVDLLSDDLESAQLLHHVLDLLNRHTLRS